MKISGIIAYPITPFSACGEHIDFDVLASCLEQLIDAGSDAIAPLGSTGESAYLNQEEWEKGAAFAVKTVADRVQVIVGISEITTSQAVKKAKVCRVYWC